MKLKYVSHKSPEERIRTCVTLVSVASPVLSQKKVSYYSLVVAIKSCDKPAFLS